MLLRSMAVKWRAKHRPMWTVEDQYVCRMSVAVWFEMGMAMPIQNHEYI